VARTAEVVGDGWTVLVLRDLFNGVRRFDDLATHLGIARNVLTRRLAALVEAGIVERVPYRAPGSRERHEYRLTSAGRDRRPMGRRCGSSTRNAARPSTWSCAATRGTCSTRAARCARSPSPAESIMRGRPARPPHAGCARPGSRLGWGPYTDREEECR
jgi:DNA-binding HxlR family transcriptional regulator